MRSIIITASALLALPAAAQVAGATGAAGPTQGAVTPPGTASVLTGSQPGARGPAGTIFGSVNTSTASGTARTSVGATGSSTSTDVTPATGTSAAARAKAKAKKSRRPGVDAAAAGNSTATGNTGDLSTTQTPHPQ